MNPFFFEDWELESKDPAGENNSRNCLGYVDVFGVKEQQITQHNKQPMTKGLFTLKQLVKA